MNLDLIDSVVATERGAEGLPDALSDAQRMVMKARLRLDTLIGRLADLRLRLTAVEGSSSGGSGDGLVGVAAREPKSG